MAAFASLWKGLFYVSSRKNRVISFLSHIFERQYDEKRKTFTLHYLQFLKEKIREGWVGGKLRKEEGKPPPGDAAGQEKKKPRPTYGFSKGKKLKIVLFFSARKNQFRSPPEREESIDDDDDDNGLSQEEHLSCLGFPLPPFDPPPRAILLFQSRGSRSASPALLYLLKGRLKNPSLFDEGEICQIFSSFFKKSRRWCQGFFSHDPLLLRQSTLVSSFSLRRAPAIKKSSARPFFAPFFLPSIGSRYGTFFLSFPP